MQAIGTYIKDTVGSWTTSLSKVTENLNSNVPENCAKDFIQRFFPNSVGEGFRCIGECLSRLTSFDSKLIFVDAPRCIGKAIQGGYDRKADGLGAARYLAGSVFVGFSNACNVPIGMAQSLADLGAETMKRLAQVSPYIYAPGQTIVSKAYNALSNSQAGYAQVFNNAEKRKAVFTQFVEAIKSDFVSGNKSARVELKPVGPGNEDYNKVVKYSYLLHNLVPDVSKRQKDLEEHMKPSIRAIVGSYKPATKDQIPGRVLARTNENKSPDSGSVLQMRIRDKDASGGLTILDGGRGSGLCVSVSVQEGVNGAKGKVILAFAGTFQFAMWMTDLATMVGVKDHAFTDAAKLVKAIKEHHPDKDVELVGYSLGGALAQSAGIKHGVQVTTFNTYGLNLTQRNKSAALLQHRREKYKEVIEGIQNRAAAKDYALTDNEKKILRYVNGDVTSVISHNDAVITGVEAVTSLSSMPNQVEVLPKVFKSRTATESHTAIDDELLILSKRVAATE